MRYHIRKNNERFTIILIGLLLIICASVQAARDSELKCAGVFGDHMVLQRDIRLPVWGWAEPQDEVTVKFSGQEKITKADRNGKWKVILDPLPKNSSAQEMWIFAADTIRIKDILVGDVWLCSGQSNMEMNMRPGPDAVFEVETEISKADYPAIRLLKIPPQISFNTREDIKSTSWEICSPKTIPPFSAAGYFFGREVHERTGVPLGLINASMGASTAEAWTGAEALARLDDFKQLIQQWPRKVEQAKEDLLVYERDAAVWDERLDSLDAGYRDGIPVWARIQLDDSHWQDINLPTHWEKAGFPDYDGFMWFRKDINLDQAWIGKDLIIGLGTINDMDRVWFNGTEVGRFESSSGWTRPREYDIPASIVRNGLNVIAVRVYDVGNNGGICGIAKDMWLRGRNTNAADSVSLAGTWICQPGLDLKSIPPRPVPPDFSETNKRMPTGLYNGMIAPLTPFAIKGVIWYQGESNAGRAAKYHDLLTAMIGNWRGIWQQGDFPFGIVQLPNYLPRQEQPSESSWAELREAQALTAASVTQCGLAVTIDIGEADYIHPRNKQDVGKRLALWALAKVYNQSLDYSGPVFKAFRIENQRMIVDFDFAEKGLLIKGHKKLKGFAIAGGDKIFHWAQATVKDNQVIVWSEKVRDPIAVRYAWADNPDCNLYNAAGLPAAPFRTDNW